MTPKERVLAALNHQEVDHPPRFEIWIDALVDELGYPDTAAAHAGSGQDAVMLPSRHLAGSNAWGSGTDEWGRVWRNGVYIDGVLDSPTDLERYSPDLALAADLFDVKAVEDVRQRYPDHCMIYGTHIGPFMASYMAMGFQQFFYRLVDDPEFMDELMRLRTDWAIAQFSRAVQLGADVIVVGDDAAHRDGPMVSPEMWRRFVLPCHQRLVASLPVPVIWHSDGDVRRLLPMAVEAGFSGFHSLEPVTGIDLEEIGREYGQRLSLIGNIDITVLFGKDPGAVRREVQRCLEQGKAAGKGYMIATCNSIFPGMNPEMVKELFSCLQASLGYR